MSHERWCFWKKVEQKKAGVSELERSETSCAGHGGVIGVG